MGVQYEILAIERELTAMDISVAAFCRAAALSPTTWVRWKNGASGYARPSVWLKVETALHRLRESAAQSKAA